MSYWYVGAIMIAGMVLGSIFTTLYYYYRTQQFLDMVKEQLSQHQVVDENATLPILCEYADRRFFAYDPDTLDFLAHGKTLEDLLAALDQRLSRTGNYHIHTDPETAERLRQETSHNEA